MKNSNSERIRFSKWQGIGNHFIVALVDPSFLKQLTTEKIQQICRPHFGVGADGVLLLEDKEVGPSPVVVHMYNPDGTLMGMCGNGIRSVFGFYQKYIDTNSFEKQFLVEGRLLNVTSNPDRSNFSVEMGEASHISEMKFLINSMDVLGYYVEVPNPHVVIPCEILPTTLELAEWGSIIENDPRFPNRTNVEFVKTHNQNQIEVAVWERGAGRTLACGTGACASVVILHSLDKINPCCTVILPGGNLSISLKINSDKTTTTMILSGPAKEIFIGDYQWS